MSQSYMNSIMRHTRIVSISKTYQIEEVFGHMPQHAWICGPKYILGLIRPSFVLCIIFQVINKLKENSHIYIKHVMSVVFFKTGYAMLAPLFL